VLGLVVVEAALRSGSLITARLALEASREIFAVPGSPRDPRAAGSNDLIRQGAHITETAEDILAHLPQGPREAPLFQLSYRADPQEDTQSAVEPATDDQGKVLEMIGTTPVAVDDLARRCHLSTPTMQAILLDLEMSGLVESLPGNRVARSAG
jgi:DNA processing protein